MSTAEGEDLLPSPPPPGLDLPLSPGHTLTVFLFEEVKNTESVREALLDGRLPDLALVNPDTVASSFHLAVAATTALINASQGALNVKSLHAELVFCLSPTCNISESFKNFGTGKNDTRVLMAFIDSTAEDIAKGLAVVQGRAVDPKAALDAPITGERETRLRKAFKIGPSEPNVENAVVTRVAAKKYL